MVNKATISYSTAVKQKELDVAYLHQFCSQFQNIVYYIEFFFLIGLFLHLEIQIDLQPRTVLHSVNCTIKSK